MSIFYTGRETFDKSDGEAWEQYVRWLGRPDLERVITLDPMLCPSVIQVESTADWNVVVQEDFMLEFFTDLAFVRQRLGDVAQQSMLLAVAREPTALAIEEGAPGFEFAGFDVVDKHGGASALVNCGGFPDVFSVSELSCSSGLVLSRDRAYEIRDGLRRLHPEDVHADCYVWAIWRYVEPQ